MRTIVTDKRVSSPSPRWEDVKSGDWVDVLYGNVTYTAVYYAYSSSIKLMAVLPEPQLWTGMKIEYLPKLLRIHTHVTIEIL